MSKWKEVIERFFEDKKGRILTIGLAYLVSTTPSLGKEMQNLSENNTKNNMEIKAHTPEVVDEDTALFDIARDALMADKAKKAEPKKNVDTFTLNVVLSRAKPEKMTFSDGTVASITYGYVNGSKSEEPVIVSLKRPNDKYRTVVSLSNALNCGKELKKIAEDLGFAKDHDVDVTNSGDYSPTNILTIKRNLQKDLGKVGDTLREINDNRNREHNVYSMNTENTDFLKYLQKKNHVK